MPARRVAEGLIAWRWPLLATALATAVWAFFAGPRLEFDRSIDKLFARDDPLLVPYHRLKRVCGGDELALAAYVDPDLLTDAGLNRLQALTEKLAACPGIESTFSLTNSPLAKLPILDTWLLTEPRGEPLLKISEGFTLGADRKTAAVVCVFMPEVAGQTPRAETVDRLRAIIEEHDATGVLTGEPVMVVDGFRYLEDDGARLGATATVLLMAVIILCFRSLRWVIVPLAVVYAALWWTQAVLAGSGYRLSMVSSMLWAIVTVIGIATVIHLIVSFRSGRLAGMSPREALTWSGGLLGAPIFWSCATDAGGFASLMISKVGPVRDFGWMMTVGSLVTLVAIALIVPGLALWGRFDADPRRAWGEGRLDLGLRAVVIAIIRRPKSIGLVLALAFGVAAAGAYRLGVETDFTRNFRDSSPIVRAYSLVEDRLGGAGVWDILIPIPETPNPDFLDRVRSLEGRLRSEVVVTDSEGRQVPGLTKTLSLVDALDTIDSMIPVALSRFLEIGALDRLIDAVREQLPVAKSLYGRDDETGRTYLRIMLRARERQPSEQKQRLIEEVRAIAREEFPEAEVTGFFVLLTRLIESMIRDQWVTFGLASAAIWLMVLAAFRDPRLATIALVPNAMPILAIMGLMGWLQLRINMGAAMIASVSMGLAVDSSFHYLSAYLRERRAGRSLNAALDAVHQSVGRAMVFSTLALVVGFGALTLSHFVPTIYFGVLVGLTMIGGLIGNLVVLPLLLKLFG